MPGSLNDILPEPISVENEEVVLDHFKRKMKIAAEVAVLLLHGMEDRFGAEAREVVRHMAKGLTPIPHSDPGKTETDLYKFCAQLDKNCAGSHKWQRVINEPGQVGYHYTRCMWAEIFHELGEPELGLVICATDEPAVKAYNAGLGFARTKTLMDGDQLCDHIFYVEREEESHERRIGS
jgi:hypothetical protein